MQTNAKIRIYSADMFLFKVNNINGVRKCTICSKLTKTSEQPQLHEDIKKYWRRSGVFIVNFEQIPHLLGISRWNDQI